MYRCRFRNVHALISAHDVCRHDTILGFLDDPERFVENHPLTSPFPNDKLESFVWGDLFRMACDLHGLSYILNLCSREPNKLGDVQREYFEDTYAAVQHSLVSFPYPQAAGIVRSCRYYRQHCWRLAALLYFNMAIRTWGPTSAFMTDVVANLTSALRESDMFSSWSPDSEVLLWVLTMGICGAWHAAEKGWLEIELKSLLKVLDVKSFDEFETLLKSFLYRESTFRQPLLDMWTEISS